MTNKLPQLNLVYRHERPQNNPLLCWYDDRTGNVNYYDVLSGYHSDMSYQYYLENTYDPQKPTEAQNLFEWYTKGWEGHSIPKLRRKLR